MLTVNGHDGSGTTAQRPANAEIGQPFFDTQVGAPLVWNGTAWGIAGTSTYTAVNGALTSVVTQIGGAQTSTSFVGNFPYASGNVFTVAVQTADPFAWYKTGGTFPEVALGGEVVLDLFGGWLQANGILDETQLGSIDIQGRQLWGTSGSVATAAMKWGDGAVGFCGAAPHARIALTGAKGGNTALASVIAALVTFGLATDSTT